MTRINCIPPSELTDKHLIAEYRELPRVFRLARRAPEAPKQYTLGKGHVMFFYDKLGYICKRYVELIDEMKKRGFNPSYAKLPAWAKNAPAYLWNEWTPTPEAMALNRQRIAERLNARRQTKTD